MMEQDTDAVIVAPKRYQSQCRMWDCGRVPPGFYCNFGHGLRSKSEEVKPRAAVYLDSLSGDDEASLSLKILTTKSQGQFCGVPPVSMEVLQQNPSESPHVFEVDRMEGETLRNWAFMSDTIPPPNIWARYHTKTILGMERISWQLRLEPEVGWYRLRRYTLPTYASSLYWLHFEWDEGSNTTENTASISIPKTHKGPPGPGASGPSGAHYMSDKGASTSGGHCNMTFKGTSSQLGGVMDVSDNQSLHSSLLILSRALRLSGRINADDAVRATLASIAWDTSSLPSEDSVSELRRKLQDEYVQEEEGEEMTIDILTASKAHARAIVLEQQDDLCKLSCALALLASTSLGCRERGELLRLLMDEVEFYYTMVEKATEADEVSYALMEKVDKLMQNFEKELFGQAFQLLDRDGLQCT